MADSDDSEGWVFIGDNVEDVLSEESKSDKGDESHFDTDDGSTIDDQFWMNEVSADEDIDDQFWMNEVSADEDIADPFAFLDGSASDMPRSFQWRMAACDNPLSLCSNVFPKHIKRRADMGINDVIKENCLAFLPAKSLARFRAVCREWDKWITTPLLAHQQSYCFRDISGFFYQDGFGSPSFLSLQPVYGVPSPSLDFLSVQLFIRSSCNGLLLCQGQDYDYYYYVCNPASKEWKLIPSPGYFHGYEPAIVLAFDPSPRNIGDHYHLVCAVPLIGQPVIYFEIFSSESQCWRRSSADCVELEDSVLTGNNFYMDGVVYWETSSREVLAFDLKNEICGILSLPEAPGGVLTQMDGELSYVSAHFNQLEDLLAIDIYGGMDMSLRRSVSVPFGFGGSLRQVHRVVHCGNGNVVTVIIGSGLYSVWLSDQKVEALSRFINTHTKYLPYVNSLVPVA